MDDMDCDGCGARMRWETSHSRCDRCGYIRPCCEGAPVSAGCVVPRADERASAPIVVGHDEDVGGPRSVDGS